MDTGFEVFGASRSPESFDVSYDTDELNFIQCDLNHDIDSLAYIIRSNKISHIINFAAQSIVEHSWEHPDHWYSTNVASLSNLVNKLSRFDFIDKYVQVSTPEVYGSRKDRVFPSREYNPSTPYAGSKAAADNLLDIYNKQFSFPVSFVRSSNVYGEYQQAFKIIPKTVYKILKGEKLLLHGGGMSRRDFIHISDVSRAEMLVLLYGQVGDIYHISTEAEWYIRDLVDRICVYLDVDFHDHVIDTEDRIGKDDSYILDSSSTRALNWIPEVTLEEGIERVVDRIKKVPPYMLEAVQLEYVHKQ